MLVGQRYDILQYKISDGLVQSQVNNLLIDHQGFLWISTIGGISRFDGKDFINFNYSQGLKRSLSEYVFGDSENRIWMATAGGVQFLQNNKIQDVKYKDTIESLLLAQEIVEAPNGKIYFLSKKGRLYEYEESTNQINVLKTPDGFITSISIIDHTLGISIYKKGIFILDQNEWKEKVKLIGADTILVIKQMVFNPLLHEMHFLTNKAVFSCDTSTYDYKPLPIAHDAAFTRMYLCGNDDFFIATLRGALKWNRKNNVKEELKKQNGLTDNAVTSLASDRESNIWFGTDGDGIYKLSPNANKIIDQSSGLSGNIVMALAKHTNGSVFAGALEHGLSVIKDRSVFKFPLPNGIDHRIKINSLLIDKNENIWLGTIGSGLWKLIKNRAIPLHDQAAALLSGITSLYEHSDGTVWVATVKGLFKVVNNRVIPIKGINRSCFSINSYAGDTLLIGTAQGLRKIHALSDSAHMMYLPYITNFLISAVFPFKNYLVIATSENGVYMFDRDDNSKYKVFNETNGLSSNIVFSMLQDSCYIYLGTSHGLNRLHFQHDKILLSRYKTGKGKGPECNQNAIFKNDDGTIWVGTTEGIIIYDVENAFKPVAPVLLFNSLQVLTNGSNLNIDLTTASAFTFPYTQNHLLFQLQGLHLSSFDDIQYQYSLSGSGDSYSAPQSLSTVMYSDLPPGEYVFKAKASMQFDSTLQSDPIHFSFSITPPFYKTKWFNIFSIVSLLLIGAGMYRYRIYYKNKQLALINQVRKQEQLKIQQRTSEDLHDDLGNKITRLALLTDILETKSQQNNDEKRILAQIRENIQGLYHGTKDIIWALAPNNHTLYDTIQRIKHFGLELFQDSNIKLIMDDPQNDAIHSIQPPFEISRNLIMICKEAMHNVLKHSKAGILVINYEMIQKGGLDLLTLSIRDNGIGFLEEDVKKGNGLDNMQKRIARIGGELQIIPAAPGTEIRVQVKIPQMTG